MAEYPSSATFRMGAQPALKGAINVATLTGTLTMDSQSSTYQKLDPGGAARTVLLPPTPPSYGPFVIQNTADAGVEALTVKNSANAVTIGTVRPGETAVFVYDTDADAFVMVDRHNQPEAVIGATTAAAGSVTGDAGVLPAGTARAYPVSGADDTKGVRIHASDAVTGREFLILNQVSNKILKVYPPTGGTINGLVADTAVSSASGRGLRMFCADSATLAFYTV